MSGNYANAQNRTKPEHMYGQQNQAGTDHNHDGLLEHGFHVGGIPIPPVISGKFKPTFFSLVILGSSTFGLFSLDLSIGRFFGKDVAVALCIKKLAHSPSITSHQNCGCL